MTVAATIPDLIEAGYLVDCDVYAPSEPDMTGIKQARNAFGDMDYTDADVGRAANKPELVGDIVTHWLRLARGTPTVCFAANIAHSKHIVERFHAAGVVAPSTSTATPRRRSGARSWPASRPARRW
jgi:superfamily II DNA or RNA helicase